MMGCCTKKCISMAYDIHIYVYIYKYIHIKTHKTIGTICLKHQQEAARVGAEGYTEFHFCLM